MRPTDLFSIFFWNNDNRATVFDVEARIHRAPRALEQWTSGSMDRIGPSTLHSSNLQCSRSRSDLPSTAPLLQSPMLQGAKRPNVGR